MSRIGKLPIKIPSNVDITCDNLDITVKGKFGTLHNKIPDILGVEQKDGTLIVVLKNKVRNGSALHGLHRTLISNMVIGVSEQFEVILKLTGVGSHVHILVLIFRVQTDTQEETHSVYIHTRVNYLN